MSQITLSLEGDPNIGLHGFATEKFAVVGGAHEKKAKIAEALDVGAHDLHLLHMDLIKLFMAGNSRHLIAPDFLPDSDMKRAAELALKLDVELVKLDTPRAVGNLILMNDNGALLSPLLERHKPQLDRALGFDCRVATVAGLWIIGSAALATNKGCLAHPNVADNEAKLIEKVLQVPVDVGTVNFGAPYPGSGVIANSRGFVAGSECSGVELGRIAEALGFVK
jgi:translation initiation factor 6